MKVKRVIISNLWDQRRPHSNRASYEGENLRNGVRRVRIESIGCIWRTVRDLTGLRPKIWRYSMSCDPKLETREATERDL